MRHSLALVLLALVAAVASTASARDPPKEEGSKPVLLGNAKCPITQEEVDPNVTTVWDGMVVRFCCPGCIDKFKADPTAFAKELLVDLAGQLSEAKARVKELEAKCAAAEAKAATPPAPPAPAAPSTPSKPPSTPEAPMGDGR